MLQFLLFFKPACLNTELFQKHDFLRANFSEALSLVALVGWHVSEVLAELPTDRRSQHRKRQVPKSSWQGKVWNCRGNPSWAGWSEESHHWDSTVPSFSGHHCSVSARNSEGVEAPGRLWCLSSRSPSACCGRWRRRLSSQMLRSPACFVSGGPSVPVERAGFACDVGNEQPLGAN